MSPTWMQVLLSAIQGDKLLIILQFSRCSKVSQLVHNCPVVLDELHDVARLQITVHQVVVPLTIKAKFLKFSMKASYLRWFIPADR